MRRVPITDRTDTTVTTPTAPVGVSEFGPPASKLGYSRIAKMDNEMEPATLSSELRGRTRALHTKAERSGIIADILHRRATRRSYALFLRNLAPAYRQLESGLDRHRHTPGVGTFARRELYRSTALESDLVELVGPRWRDALPPPAAASERYSRSIESAASGSGAGLIGHAYVRYLGDLNGGQIMKRLLTDSLGLRPQALSFYDFPEVEDLAAYKRSFVEALDVAPLSASDRAAVIATAIGAFSSNIEVSEAVRHAVLEPEAGPS
jgi:heme oxygenase